LRHRVGHIPQDHGQAFSHRCASVSLVREHGA
jgi:hypothetical protein